MKSRRESLNGQVVGEKKVGLDVMGGRWEAGAAVAVRPS